MSVVHSDILKEHGFYIGMEDDSRCSRDDLFTTSLAFFHDISNTLFDDDSPFCIEKSIVNQCSDENALVECKLQPKAPVRIDDALRYTMSKWHEYLRYENPTFEHIETELNNDGASIRLLTISESGKSAITIEFTLLPYQ